VSSFQTLKSGSIRKNKSLDSNPNTMQTLLNYWWLVSKLIKFKDINCVDFYDIIWVKKCCPKTCIGLLAAFL
jgi:hypothetical protein